MWWKDLLKIPTSPQAHVVYVDTSAEPNGDGNSWNTAFTDLQLAIEIAAIDPNKTDVWVAEGIYRTDDNAHSQWLAGDVRASAFHTHDGVAVYGGFLGFENSVESRCGSRDNTILSALHSDGLTRSYNVFRQYNGDGDEYGVGHVDLSQSTVDGFTFRDSSCNGTSSSSNYLRARYCGAVAWLFEAKGEFYPFYRTTG